MFTKLAAFLVFGVGRRQRLRAMVGRRADVHPDRRRIADSHRNRRPTLICRWQRVPAGALECRWQVIDLPETDELAQWRHGRATQSPTAARAMRRRRFAPAAA